MPDETEEFEEAETPEEVKAPSEDAAFHVESDDEETPEAPKSSVLDVLTPEGQESMRRLFVTMEGGDPDATQTLNDFLKFKNPVERSNLPNTDAVLAVTQLMGYGMLFYPDDRDNPFDMIGNILVTSFMAKGGWKSDGFVEMMRQQPDLSSFQTANETAKRGFVDRLLGRGRAEG